MKIEIYGITVSRNLGCSFQNDTQILFDKCCGKGGRDRWRDTTAVGDRIRHLRRREGGWIDEFLNDFNRRLLSALCCHLWSRHQIDPLFLIQGMNHHLELGVGKDPGDAENPRGWKGRSRAYAQLTGDGCIDGVS